MENSSQIPLPKARGPPCGDLLSDKSDHLPPRLPNNCSCSCSEKIHLPQPHHAFPENKIGEVHTMSICSTTGCPLGCCSTCCPSSCPLTLTSCRLSQGKGCSAHSTVSGPKLHCSLSWGILGPCAPHWASPALDCTQTAACVLRSPASHSFLCKIRRGCVRPQLSCRNTFIRHQTYRYFMIN